MKTLILARHAKTEQLAAGDTKSDFERELKPRGYKDCRLVSTDLLNRHIQPGLLITSNAVRAQQTAVTFAELLSIDSGKIIQQPFLYNGYTTPELLSYLARFDRQHQSIMIVGHNPEIAMSASVLSNHNCLHFPTSAAVAISFNVESWQQLKSRSGKIECFITPKMLK